MESKTLLTTIHTYGCDFLPKDIITNFGKEHFLVITFREKENDGGMDVIKLNLSRIRVVQKLQMWLLRRLISKS